ncbi:MAG: recombination protein RecR [Deltaproteobacteria bacterium]|nr:recombination protein RecR [Deltaproteobacteria bacterium]
MQYAEPITRLVKALSRLPGVGEKTAGRLALYVLNTNREYAEELARSLINVKDNVRLCSECMTFSESDPCSICGDDSRDKEVICVVGDYKDMIAIEASFTKSSAINIRSVYNGRYHILHGLLAPLKGIGPEEIKLKELAKRIGNHGVKEVIIATPFDGEGEATAHYIGELLKDTEVSLSRIAAGIPVGGSIEYMDASTLSRAMDGRRKL